ncbi:MAG: porin family protein [Ginsengibacter sp.]
MKFTFLMLLMILLTAFSLTAQKTIGITAGASFANVTVKSQGISASLKLKPGLTAGIMLNVPLSGNFIFQPALNFVQKGYKVKDDFGTETVTLNYLEVPLNIIYNTKKIDGFFIGAGPSLAYGISGTDKVKYPGSGMPDENNKVKFGSGVEEVKGFDFGVNAIAGYRLAGGFMISANYNLGLSKINNDDGSGENGSIKNKYYSLKIGYTFGGKLK